MVLPDIHSLVKSLYTLDLINEDIMNMIITYMVEQGYDADDYASLLGLSKASSLIHRLCVSNADKITNVNFQVHLEEFVRNNMKSLTKMQLLRLQEVVNKIPRFAPGSQDNDLSDKLQDHLMMGAPDAKKKDGSRMTLHPDNKDDPYESDQEYDDIENDENGF
jgi:hypothetical protein